MHPTNRILRAISLIGAFVLAAATSQAVSPPPDGGYPNENTAEGEDALFSLTTGTDNTAIGFEALFNNTTGYFNTANGAGALAANTTGFENTANGVAALEINSTGSYNTAHGFQALRNNTTGSFNTATGTIALFLNTTGFANTANGTDALNSNTTGKENTATGAGALQNNTTGNNNTADGFNALFHNTTGDSNMAEGQNALKNNSIGSGNIALGFNAGIGLTTGDRNIDIGNSGLRSESSTIRIGTKTTHRATFVAGINGVTVANGVGVIINTQGQLGTVVSSERYKDGVKPMENASEAILSLQPVSFRYKHDLDPDGIPQFGLVAEQVEKVNPDLVAKDDQGKPYTVRYEAVNAMLLNEFIKEHRKGEEQDRKIEALEAQVAQQQRESKATINQMQSALKEQAAEIQKVSARLATDQAAPRVVVNNQ